MAKKSSSGLIPLSFERPKQKRPGRHKKKLNKRNKPKTFFG